jgi:hypothetical protein
VARSLDIQVGTDVRGFAHLPAGAAPERRP